MSDGARTGDSLQKYRTKRNFGITPEPSGAPEGRARRETRVKGTEPATPRGRPAPHAEPGLSFVIQKHWASRLHYDFRLELDGVLLSWAVPKGPSFDPKEKRMAVHVEDHPVSYGGFEGVIPPKQYGAGRVIVWDRGTWEPVGDPREGMRNGKLLFRLHGQKLAGLWELVRIAKPGDKQDPWMLFKKRDAWARPLDEYDVISALPDSVVDRPLGLVEEREPRERVADGAPGRTDTPDLSNAVKAPLPQTLSPQLATLSRTVPAGPGWLYEIKFDGYRVMARIDRGKAKLITRGGHDWTARMQPLAAAIEALGIRSAWLDGEVVVLDDDNVPDFNALQNAFDSKGTDRITCFLFDLPFHDGRDLRGVPLTSRRALLRELLQGKENDRVRLSEAFETDGASFLTSACAMKLEGIIAKRADAPYVCARTETWLKLKCSLRQEFVIGGFTLREGSAAEVGSMMLGVHDERGVLRYAGNVGTGWDAKTGKRLLATLKKHEVAASPFEPGAVKPGRWSRRRPGGEHWVEPTLVAEVSFTEWTPDGHVRHGKFHGLRDDKPAKSITREEAVTLSAGTDASAAVAKGAAGGAPRSAGVKVSNPERVIDPSTGLRKLDLVRYYESVAERMLPHLKGRPVSLVRGPTGITGDLFFQKHPETRMPGMTELDPRLWPGHAALMEVGSVEALVSAAQMNVIEFHTWNAKHTNIDRPDRMIFDLDPGEGTTWQAVQEAAMLTKALLDALGLVSFLKTSGGKGLHVVVPLTPRDDWETVKSFSQAVVVHLARTIPDRFVAKSGAANRVGKLFVDYIRNSHGATTAAAFSARARPGLGVSIPVSWEQLSSLKSGAQWTIATAREHLSFEKDDPWAAYWTSRQTLGAAMKALGFKASARPA
jgi:bifunctional non-homologous end joining protein LigD